MVKTAPPGFIGPEEILEKLGEIANEEDRAFVAGLWLTGARTGELAVMERKDLRERNQVAGNWWCELVLLKRPTTNKGKRPTRYFPISPIKGNQAEDAIRAIFLAYVLPKEGRVFASYSAVPRTIHWRNKRTGSMMKRTVMVFHRPYNQISRKNDILLPTDKDTTIRHRLALHWIRTFRLSWLCHQCQNPRIVQEWVGHASVQTTEMYLKTTPGAQEEYWERFNAQKEETPARTSV